VGKEGRKTAQKGKIAMSVYRRGEIWWYKFWFCGQLVRESSKSESKTVAKEAERERRRQLTDSFNGIRKPRNPAKMFSLAFEEWISAKEPHLAPRSVVIERANWKHLNPFFGKMLLCDVTADDITSYQAERLRANASPKTVNLEIGTIRAVLRKHRLWAAIQPDVKMFRASGEIGRAITRQEETNLLDACRDSRCRVLLPAVTLALSTAMRYSEIRLLCWSNVNLADRNITVAKSKTESGEGRTIPLNDRAFAILSFWAGLFPDRQIEDYVFPAERYGAAGDDFTPCAHSINVTKPIGSWGVAWAAAKKRAGVTCRFHDLRHTACTRMLEAGVPFSVVASLMGWSASTTVRMAKRYGHIGQDAQRQAVAVLSGSDCQRWGTKLGTVSEDKRERCA
jgi:integrase